MNKSGSENNESVDHTAVVSWNTIGRCSKRRNAGVGKWLMTSLGASCPPQAAHFLHFALDTDSKRRAGSSLQGAAPQRATISLLVNKAGSNDLSAPPPCLDHPAPLTWRGCFVKARWRVAEPLELHLRDEQKEEQSGAIRSAIRLQSAGNFGKR